MIVVADRRLGLAQDLLTRVDQVLTAMAAVGHPMFIVQGLRTAAAQHELWRQGREIPGPDMSADRPLGRVVTYCDGITRKSNHQAGLDDVGHAVDCAFVKGEPFGETQPWLLYGLLGETVGLKWGGRWTHPVDRPHLEL